MRGPHRAFALDTLSLKRVATSRQRVSGLREDAGVGPQVGDPDGYGTFGVVDETADGLLCHDCGRRFTHLGLHAFKAHEVTAAEYRQAHGLGRQGLVVKATAQAIADNARRTMPSRTAFLESRDPAAASAAQRGGAGAVSPAGLAAIRESAHARRGTRRLGTVVTCEWCGVQFCPLVGAARRRFCSRSCSARNNRQARET